MEEQIRHGFTVKDLFAIPHFKDAVLLGGHAGLEQTISKINVMEVPDVIHWVRPGEFLMTTGYPFRDEPEVLETLIAQLVQKGVVALGIKTKRFIDSVPEAAVKAADRYGLPLIELPPGTTFSDVVREVMERVLVTESKHLSILQSRVQRLSHVLLHGDGLSAFLHHLQLLIHNPVVLLGPGSQWTASPSAEHLCKQVDEAGWKKLREDRNLETNVIRIGDQAIRVYISAVPDGQSQPYLLLMLEHQSEYGIVDTLTMNWASELVGFEISNAQARQNIEAKYIDQFLQDWIAGRIVSSADLRIRAEACGCPLMDRASFLTGLVSFHDRRAGVDELQELARRLNREGSAGNYKVKWTVLEEALVVLLMLKSGEGGDKRPNKEAVATVRSMLRSVLPDRRVTLCVGREAQDEGAVPAGYREAKRAAEVCSVSHTNDEILHYEDLGIYLLLYRLQGTEELAEFRRMYLQPLLDYDRKHQGSLMQTLRTYFLCNCNAKETAERMFLHYNTVNYRLERIRSELGLRLDNAETRLNLQLALKLNEINDL